ncbi:MAG: c-type cytochrome domain-containing protein, partial [Fidelibacterota bacterium]
MKQAIILFLALGMLFGQVDYESQIQTIFNSNCTSCHTGNYNGGLDLTSYDNVMAGGNSGAVIVPSDHGNSILWQKVNSGVMPPETNPDLNTSEVSLIADWIDEGALETPAVDVTDLFLSEYAEG